MKLSKLSIYVVCSAIVGVALSYSDLYFFHLMLIFLIVFHILDKKNSFTNLEKSNLKTSRMLLPFVIAFSWYAISMAWSENLIYSIKYLFYLFCGISLVAIIVSHNSSLKSFEKLFKPLSLLLLIELIIGIMESLTSFQMPISRYSSLSPLFGKELQAINQSDFLLGIISSPPTGFHWDTNEFAITMMLIVPFFLCLNNVSIKTLGTIAVTFLIIMSSSRAVFFGLISIGFLYFVFIKKNIKSLFLIISFILFASFAMVVLLDSRNPNLNEIANTLNTAFLYLSGDIDIAGSLKWRRELLDNGINALINTNGLGVAAGGSVHIQEELGGVDGRFTSMHNFWAEVLVEGGIIFFISFIFWLTFIIIKLLKISRLTKDKKIKYYSSSLFLAISGFIPAAISSSSTIYYFPMWILFGLCLSIIKISNESGLKIINS